MICTVSSVRPNRANSSFIRSMASTNANEPNSPPRRPFHDKVRASVGCIPPFSSRLLKYDPYVRDPNIILYDPKMSLKGNLMWGQLNKPMKNPHYSRTSSSQLLKGNGSPCLQLASSTLSRCHVSSSATSPWVPTRYSPWCAEIGRGLGAELDSSLLSPLTSFFCDQRKEYPLSFSLPHAGQSCLACALWLLARRPGVLEKGGARCR